MARFTRLLRWGKNVFVLFQNVICDFQVSSLQFGLHVINNQTSKTENDKNNGQPPRDNHVGEGSKNHVALTYEYLLSVEQLKAQIRGEVDDGEDQTKKNLVKLSWNRGKIYTLKTLHEPI